jgi:hypothetical protein
MIRGQIPAFGVLQLAIDEFNPGRPAGDGNRTIKNSNRNHVGF